MKIKNSLRKLTLIKATVAHLNDEQMTDARGGSCAGTWKTMEGCVQNNSYTPTQVDCI